MERLALSYKVKTGKLDKYIEIHREVWPDVVESLRESGCLFISIFRRDQTMFLYAEVESIERFNKRKQIPGWNDLMDETLIQPLDESEPSHFAVLGECWSYDFTHRKMLFCEQL